MNKKTTISFHPLFYILWIATLACFFVLRAPKNGHKHFVAIGKEAKALAMKGLQKTSTPVTLPKKLARIPSGEKSGLVIDTTDVTIHGEEYPYNASITKGTDGYYWLFFRYDQTRLLKDPRTKSFANTFIGMARLNDDFTHADAHFTPIDTGSSFSEDPRIFTAGKRYYLVYNDLLPLDMHVRSIKIAQFDPNRHQIDYATNIDQHISLIEKNWIPFSYAEAEESTPFFAYQINPHKIMKLRDPKKNSMEHLLHGQESNFAKLSWQKKWGTLRGGTPAQLVDGQYLAFFHSAFKENGATYKEKEKTWYVMGAYTFEAKPPFRITGISKHPITYKGMYDTPHEHFGNPRVCVVFPAGFVVDKKGDREVIHVSCGENDCATKIVTLDKQALLDSLMPVQQAQPMGYYQ